MVVRVLLLFVLIVVVVPMFGIVGPILGSRRFDVHFCGEWEEDTLERLHVIVVVAK